MQSIGYLLVVMVIGAIIFAAQSAAVTAPGRALQEKFKALGQMPGKSREEIIAAVGNPNSISAIPDGVLLQWQAPGYHIAIRFKDDMFDGITHEFAN